MDSQYINCPKCGTRNFIDDKVCGVCKAKLVVEIQQNKINPREPIKANYFIIILFFAGLAFIYYTIFHKNKPKENEIIVHYNKSDSSLSPSISTKNYLLSSVQEFRTNFNSFSKKYNLGLKITKLNIQNGEVNNSFMYMLNQQVGLVGTVSKNDNSLKGITMIGQGNGLLKSGVDILATMLCIIGAVDPSLSGIDRKKIMEQLGFLDEGVDLYNLSNSIIRNGIKYFINSSRQIGITCGAEVP